MELLFLAIAASVSVASLMLWSQAKRAQDQKTPRALPAHVDRTPLTVQIGDVVEHLDRDWLVEGALALSESPRGARLCRLMDGAEECYLYAGSHTDETAWLLRALETVPEARTEELAHDGERLRLERRWQAAVLSAGKLGRRSYEPELTIYEYAGAAGRLLLVLDGATKHTAFLGDRVLPHALEILPGRG